MSFGELVSLCLCGWPWVFTLRQSLCESRRPLCGLGGGDSFHQIHNRQVRKPIPLSYSNSPSETRYDYQAYKNNAILIPCCGFDSVPADVVVYLANQTTKSVLGPSACIEDSTSLYKIKGGLSGGTLASIISSLEDVPRTFSNGVTKDFSYRERERVPLHDLAIQFVY